MFLDRLNHDYHNMLYLLLNSVLFKCKKDIAIHSCDEILISGLNLMNIPRDEVTYSYNELLPHV